VDAALHQVLDALKHLDHGSPEAVQLVDNDGVPGLEVGKYLLEDLAIQGLAAGVFDVDWIAASRLQGLDLSGCVLLVSAAPG
jgi:hypothetical protein